MIDGRKFDFRIFVQLVSLDPLEIYVFKRGVVKFAAFSENDFEDEDEKRASQLTNLHLS